MQELGKIKFCGKTFMEFDGLETQKKYFKNVNCNKWFCPDCGGLKGRINKKRISSVLRVINKNDGTYFLRQFVFTIPKDIAHNFQTKKQLNKLINSAKRLIQRFYSKKQAIGYIHLFGERSGADYHPHVNVHVIEDKGLTMRLQRETLKEIKDSWLRAVRSMGYSINKIDVHYSYTQPIMPMIIHRIRYMTRPLGIDDPVKIMNKIDVDMLKFLVMEMKGFIWVRYWGKRDKNIKDGETMNEIKKSLPESVRFVGVITKDEFFARYRMGDLECLGDGLFVTKESESKHKKKNNEKKVR